MFEFLKKLFRKSLTQDEACEKVLYPFQKTEHWLHQHWQNDVHNEGLAPNDPDYKYDDEYGQRHDAYDAELSLIFYLYRQGYEIVKK
jgi:hypothetical protein